MAVLIYNGFADLEYIRVDSWETAPVFATDGRTVQTMRNRMRGRAVLTGVAADLPDSQAAFRDLINGAYRTLNQPGKALRIELSGDGTAIVNLEGRDDLDGPRVSFEFSEPVGGLSSVCRWEVEWSEYRPELVTSSRNTVLENRWSSTWTVNTDGLSVYQVSGRLTVTPMLQTGSGTWDGSRDTNDDPTNFNIGIQPDRYRDLILPNLPQGHIVRSQQFIVDETGRSVAYFIRTEEYMRAIPAPAKDGAVDFTWRKSIFSLNSGMVGEKNVRVSLDGDKTATPAGLLAAATAVIQSYVDFERDQIGSIMVSQPDGFIRNRLEMEVSALQLGGVAEEAENPESSGPNDNRQPRTGPARIPMIQVQRFLEEYAEQNGSYAAPPPYATLVDPDSPPAPGAWEVWEIRRRFEYQPDDTFPALPVAHTDLAAERQIYSMVYTLPSRFYEDLVDRLDPGLEPVSPQSQENPIIAVEAEEDVEVLDTGMHEMKSQSLDAASKIFQVRKPKAMVHQRVKIARMRQPAVRQMLDLPRGAMVIRESFKTHTGGVDANDNRVFVSRYDRSYVIQDLGGEANGNTGFRTVQTSPPGSVLPGISQAQASLVYRTWWPPNNRIGLPFDPRVEEFIGSGPEPIRTGRDLWSGPGNEGIDRSHPVGGQEVDPYFNNSP